MGIRYLAISIAADDVERAQKDPCPFCSASDVRELDPDRGRDDYLDLDKAFGYLRTVLFDYENDEARPGHALVAGDVTNTPEGWIPFEAALSAETVREIAVDLEGVNEALIRSKLSERYRDDRTERDISYASEYLQRAKEYLAVVVSEGRGLAYRIG